MVERKKPGKDKARAQREKKVKKVGTNKEQRRIERDLRDLAQGKIDPEQFDEEYSG
jgi:hypothetical protein